MNILSNNGKYFFFNGLSIEKELTSKNYIFNFDDKGNCWLEDLEDFKIPEKVYDVSSDMRSMILNSYTSYNKNLGVLLTGNKGQGKSLTAKLLCNQFKNDLNAPVIIINKAIPKFIDFITFFNNIKQNYVLFIDEFEKLFNEENEDLHGQNTFLSFMDGVLTNEHKVLFLLTTNNPVNEFFINRPSRIKFLQEYDELDEELFNMIIDDKLNNDEFKEDLINNVSLINLNIDLLISIVDDINLLNKPFSTFKSFYNYKMETHRYMVYEYIKNNFEFLSIDNRSKKYKNTDQYIGNFKVHEILQFTKNEIIFNTIQWDEDEDGKEIKIIKKIKLELLDFFKVNNVNAYS